jgi:hypothetical protein
MAPLPAGASAVLGSPRNACARNAITALARRRNAIIK